MRFFYLNFIESITLYLLILFQFAITLNIDNLIEPHCDGRIINYSIFANFKEYLENVKNLDGNEIFDSLEVLKYKKLGTISGTYYNKTIFNLVIEYDSYDQLYLDLRTFKIDGIIQTDRYAEEVIILYNDLSLFPEPIQINKIGFGIQKNNTTLQNQINEFIKKNRDIHETNISLWTRFNLDEKHIDTKFSGENRSLNIVVRFANYPYTYKDNEEIMGSEIAFLYNFAREYGYKLNLKEVNTYEDQIESLINNSSDIAAGYFIIKNDSINDINYSEFLYKSKVYIIVRYSNLPESIEFKYPYSSIDQFRGENIGLIDGSYYSSITNSFFPDSEIILYKSFAEIYYHLLMKDIEGFVIDDLVAEYYKIVFNNKLLYYKMNISEENVGFGFQKNAHGKALLNEFNEFISTINLDPIYKKWYVLDTSKLTIDKNLNSDGKLINVALNLELKPICFIEGDEMKGFEPELLYRFAKAKKYNMKITKVNLTERISYVEQGKADISGGVLSITEDRKKKIDFSNPLYTTGLAFAVRIEKKKDEIKIRVLDNNFYEKSNNNVEVQVKFYNSIKNSTCIFPDKYNDTFLINCTISNLDNIESSKKGFEYLNTSDKINILSRNLELDNFFQANSKIIGHNNIIIEGNKDKIICIVSFSLKNGSIIASLGIILILIIVLIFSRYL